MNDQCNPPHAPAVVCLSGGMDSTSLLVHLLAQNRSVFGLSFDYGQKHKIELERLERNLDYLRLNGLNVEWNLVNLSSITPLLHSSLTNSNWAVPEGFYESDNMRQTVVPNRNAIFSSIAFAQALSISEREKTRVDFCLGVHSGDHAIYPDCRPVFYEKIFDAFMIGNWRSEQVSMYLPYLKFDKAEILNDAKIACDKLGLDFDMVFRNTLTSYSPSADGRSSGKTGSDVERILAFHKLGRKDPIEYLSSWEVVVENALQFQRDHESGRL